MKVELRGKGIKELDFSSHDPSMAESKEVFALQQIDTIDASDNDITLLKKLDVFPNLRTLILKKNKLESPISFFVRHLPWSTLTSLDLSHNDITSIEGGSSCAYGWQHEGEAEEERSGASHLDLRNAEEDVLRARVNFRSLVVLRELNLSFNSIVTPARTKQPLLGASLVVLDISYNMIDNLAPIVEGLTGLESLNAEGNKIDDIETGGVVALASSCLMLQHLFLDGNPMVHALGHSYRHAVITTFRLAAQAVGEVEMSLEVLDGIPLHAASPSRSPNRSHRQDDRSFDVSGGSLPRQQTGRPTSPPGDASRTGLNVAGEIGAQVRRTKSREEEPRYRSSRDELLEEEDDAEVADDVMYSVDVLPARARVVGRNTSTSQRRGDDDDGEEDEDSRRMASQSQGRQSHGAVRSPTSPESPDRFGHDESYEEDSSQWLSPVEHQKHAMSSSSMGGGSTLESADSSAAWQEQQRAHRGGAIESQRKTSGGRPAPGATYQALIRSKGASSSPSAITSRMQSPSTFRDEHGGGYGSSGSEGGGGGGVGRALLDQEQALTKSCFPAVKQNQQREEVRAAAQSAMKSAMKSRQGNWQKELTRVQELKKLSVMLERNLAESQQSIQSFGRMNSALEKKLSESRLAISDQLKESSALKAERAALLSTIAKLELSRQKAEREVEHAERTMEHAQEKSVRRVQEQEESRILMQQAKSAEKRRKEVLARRALNAPPPRMTNSAMKRAETTQRKLSAMDESSTYFHRDDLTIDGYDPNDVLLVDGPSPYDVMGAVPLAPQAYPTNSPARYETPKGVGSGSGLRSSSRSPGRRAGTSPPGEEAQEGFEYRDGTYFKLRQDRVEGDSSFERPPQHIRPSSSASTRTGGSRPGSNSRYGHEGERSTDSPSLVLATEDAEPSLAIPTLR